MTAKELFEYLTHDAGLDTTTANAIMSAASNEKVASKASTLKQQKDFDAIEAKATELEASYKEAKTYADWYQKHYPKIKDLEQRVMRFEERYGPLENPVNPQNPPAGAPTVQTSPDDIKKLVNEVIQGTYAPQWSSLLVNSGTVVEKHLRANRKNPIDWNKLSELSGKHGGDLGKAYEEWDAPEAQASAKAAQEAEIERRVQEQLAQRQTQNFFPAGADASPSGGITRGGSEAKTSYNRNAVIEAAVTGKYTQ